MIRSLFILEPIGWIVNEGDELSRYSMRLNKLECDEHVGKRPVLRLPGARYATPIVD